MSKHQRSLTTAINNYIVDFGKKHGRSFNQFVGDDIIGIVDFGDCFFNMSDVVYDLDNKCPKDLIFTWYNETLERQMSNKQIINFKSYSRGLTYKDL